jgi:hypothetical protein
VWPHEFHEAEGAAAIVVDEQRDTPSDCDRGDSNSAVLSGDPPPLHTLASSLDHEQPETQYLPPLPRASASPILRKKGECARTSTTKYLFKMQQVLSSITAAAGTLSCVSLQVHASTSYRCIHNAPDAPLTQVVSKPRRANSAETGTAYPFLTSKEILINIKRQISTSISIAQSVTVTVVQHLGCSHQRRRLHHAGVSHVAPGFPPLSSFYCCSLKVTATKVQTKAISAHRCSSSRCPRVGSPVPRTWHCDPEPRA